MGNANTLDDLLIELYKDPGFRAEHKRQKPFYDLIRLIITTRERIGLPREASEQIIEFVETLAGGEGIEAKESGDGV